MKNILYISPFSHIGGAEKSLLIFLKNLNSQMFKPILICYAEGPFVQQARKLGIQVIVFKKNSLLLNLSVVLKIFRCIKENDIELVHVNCLDIRAGIAAWLAKIPLIGHLRVVFPFTWRDRLFVRLAQRVVAVSNAVVDNFCKGKSSYKNKFIVIPNAVEIPKHLIPAPLIQEFRLSEDAKLVGSAGRIDPVKGYEYFIKAAALIKKQRTDVFFFIVGDIDKGDKVEEKYLKMLKALAAELGLQHHLYFTGFREEILKVIKALDVMVVPSVVLKKAGCDATEGFGRVAIEAMAVEVPVVASNIGGLSEIVEDNVSGMLVPPGNPQAIAKAILLLLADTIKATAISKAGKKRCENFFGIQKNMAMTNAIYLDILKKRQ